MTLNLPMLMQLVAVSIRTPRDAARMIMAIDLPRALRWQVLFLFVLIGAILAVFLTYLITGHAVLYVGFIQVQPIAAAMVTASGSVLTVFAIYWVGRALGGTGHFADAISVVAWLQFVVVTFQVAQLAVFIVMPPLAAVIDLAGTLLSIWLLTNFIAELHGFKSLSKVFVMILVTLFAFAFGLSLILTAIGLSVPGVAP